MVLILAMLLKNLTVQIESEKAFYIGSTLPAQINIPHLFQRSQ